MKTEDSNSEPRPTLTCEMCGSPTGSPQHLVCQWCAQILPNFEPWDFIRDMEESKKLLDKLTIIK